MVKVYLNEKGKKGKFIDVNFWSLVKNYILVTLASVGIIYGVILAILFVIGVIAWIAGLIF